MQERIKQNVAWVLKRIQEHVPLVIGVVVFVLVAGVGWWWYQQHVMKQQFRASDLLHRAQQYYGDEFETIKKEAQENEGQKTKGMVELEERFLAVIAEFPKSVHAQLAALDLSRIYDELKQEKEAVAILKKVRFSGELGPIFRMRQALFFEDDDAFDDSAKLWQSIVENKEFGGPFHGIAQLHLARLAYLQKKPKEARTLLDKVSKEYEGQFEAVQAEKIRLFYEP